MRQKIVKIGGALLGAALFVVAVIVLHHELKKYGLGAILHAVEAIPHLRLGLAILFAAGCYGALTCYDLLALRYLKNPLPYRKIALASFVGYAFSHNVGLSLVTGVPMKYRVYSTWGLRAVDVVKVAAFCGLTFWTGFCTLAGVAFLLDPEALLATIRLPIGDARLPGILLLGIVGASLVMSRRRRPVRLLRWSVTVPGTRFVVGQIVAGSTEWICAAATLYVLFWPNLPMSFPAFVSLFLLAYVSGFVSQVPGGLGVLETVILLALRDIVPAPTVMGALLAYRAIYYVLPLVIAVVLLGVHEIRRGRRGRKSGGAR